MKSDCSACNSQLHESWIYCPFCGRIVKDSNSENKRNTLDSKETQIAERFLLLANDYKALTGHTLEGEVLKTFIEHPAVGRLSVVEGDRRLKAGRKVRNSLGANKYSLDLTDWLDAVYEVNTSDSNSRVWITEGGTRYHSSRDCKGMKDGQEYARWKGKDTYNPQFIPIRRAAFVLGLTPCLVCKPRKYDGK